MSLRFAGGLGCCSLNDDRLPVFGGDSFVPQINLGFHNVIRTAGCKGRSVPQSRA